ncbi:MAG: GIY-YIG nuclease family protein [Chloroflexi bacterium]|nr:GIY-YIG nuclease family protein [Chloroflexota bacterium]
MAWYIYILENDAGRRYVGSTGRSPRIRLGEHNEGKGRWTRAHRPWRLVHSEEHRAKQDALIRERFLKTGAGRRTIDDLIASTDKHNFRLSWISPP